MQNRLIYTEFALLCQFNCGFSKIVRIIRMIIIIILQKCFNNGWLVAIANTIVLSLCRYTHKLFQKRWQSREFTQKTAHFAIRVVYSVEATNPYTVT